MSAADDLAARLTELAAGAVTPVTPVTDRLEASRVDWSSFWTRDRDGSDWLVEPLLPRGRGVALYAPSKTGKSLLSVHVSACVATGARCLDHPAGPPRHVLYLDLEMTADDLHERLEDMGYGPATNLEHLHYYVLPDLPPLDTPHGGQELVDLAAHHQAELVVIDTTTRGLSGNENDADTIRNFWRYTGSRLKAENRTMWRLDHAGKDLQQGQRGSSAKNDDVDVVWRMTALDDGVRLKATHRRLGWVPETVDLVRLDEPLRHERASVSWPAGTKDVADLLDKLDAPVDLAARPARQLLLDAGHQRRMQTVCAALRWRREQAAE